MCFIHRCPDPKIVQALNELNLNENTIIVIWGDHGFKLGEYGRWSKHSNLDVDTRVPLIIFHPGKTGKRENKLAELVDVYPTLVNLAGLPEVRHTNGVDLFAESAKGFAISQIEHDGFTGYSIRTSEFRYVAWFNKDKTEITFRELYDLRTSSMELKNVANEESMAGIAKELEEKLLAILHL
jgi:iduronate 2-sulfatase